MTRHDKTDNNSLSILSLNINGLKENKKRNNLFEKLSNKNIDTILLQDTHSTKQITEKWQKEWPGKSFWNSGEITKSSGVAILIKIIWVGFIKKKRCKYICCVILKFRCKCFSKDFCVIYSLVYFCWFVNLLLIQKKKNI